MTKEEIRLMLQTNSKGAVMQSLGNCMLVFQNDPLLKGSIRRNSLTERIDIEKDLGWRRSDTAVPYPFAAHPPVRLTHISS